MNTYRAPKPSRRMPDLPFPASAGPPRPFQEWAALRRWEKLPQAERDIPGFVLRLVREGAGLTQRELAGKLSISQPSVAQAERWTSNPTVAFLRQWAAACGALLGLTFIPSKEL